jgi:uncharacterized membrane protein YfcA
MTPSWLASAAIVALASFSLGLAGFGNGLIAMALLPFVMAPATAVVLMTIHTVLITAGLCIHLREHVRPASIAHLLAGTIVGVPLGVWVLTAVPAGWLRRIIGLVLLAVVLIEYRGLYPRHLPERRWALGAGFVSGALGAGMATPGPPVILWAAAQTWRPEVIRANLQAFFFLNQIVILAGYWWAGLLTAEVLRLVIFLTPPAIVGVAAGAALSRRIDQRRFRQTVFGLLLVSALLLLFIQ